MNTQHAMVAIKALSIPMLAGFALAGCTKSPVITYNPQDFVNPNRVVTKTVTKQVPTPKVDATFGIGNNPQVVKAYDDFAKSGIAKNIVSKGFETLAYSPYSHPIVACSPLHLCVIQLEKGERLNDIGLGDSKNWTASTALMGSAQDGSIEILVKPKAYNIATDMVITTNKRIYNVGLVSKKGETTHVVNFYYPEETLSDAVKKADHLMTSPLNKETVMKSNGTDLNVNDINFNYQIKGDYPAWRPTRVFDDGNKTFIQMPAISQRMDLPVLYILKNRKLALVNYRYRKPYYIVDGLFKKAYLLSGKGHNQVKVEIINRNFG